jgi:hypothetical protein
MGLIFKVRHWAIHPVQLQAFVYLFGSMWGAQMPISPTRIGLLIWYGAYFQANTLGHTSNSLEGL